MANPYPAQFTDDNGRLRVDGSVTFTDSGNQPGGGVSLLAQTTTISNANILAMHVAGSPAITATPGVAEIVLPVVVTVRYLIGAAYFSTNQNQALYVSTSTEYANNGGSWLIVPPVFGKNVAHNVWVAMLAYGSLDDVSNVAGGVVGQPLRLFVNDPYLGGDGSAEVYCLYKLLPV